MTFDTDKATLVVWFIESSLAKMKNDYTAIWRSETTNCTIATFDENHSVFLFLSISPKLWLLNFNPRESFVDLDPVYMEWGTPV